MNVTTIVLINGLGLPRSLGKLGQTLHGQRLLRHCRELARHGRRYEQLRRDPSSFTILGLTDVVDHYEQIIRELETPPIIIGYGFGGLVTQFFSIADGAPPVWRSPVLR